MIPRFEFSTSRSSSNAGVVRSSRERPMSGEYSDRTRSWASVISGAGARMLLRAPAGRDRPAIDEPTVAFDPDVVVQVERCSDLAGREIELAAQGRQRIRHMDRGVLVADGDPRRNEADGDGCPVLHAHDAATTSQ